MMVSGGLDYVFTPELPDVYICVVCHLALKKPKQIEECGHRFCETCFEDMKKRVRDGDEIQCPIDRQMFSQDKVFKDKATERAILNWKVRCQNHQKGCDWIGELNIQEEHAKECGFREKENYVTQANIHDIKQDLIRIDRTILTEVNEMKKHFTTEITEIKNQIQTEVNEIKNQIKRVEDANKVSRQTINQLKDEFFSKKKNPSTTGPDDLRTLTVVSDSKWEWRCPVFTEMGKDYCSPVFYYRKWCFQLWMRCKDDGNGSKLGFYLSRFRGIFDRPNNYLDNNLAGKYIIKLSIAGANVNLDLEVDLSYKPWTIEEGLKKSLGYGKVCKDGFNFIIDGFYHVTCEIIEKADINEPQSKRAKK